MLLKYFSVSSVVCCFAVIEGIVVEAGTDEGLGHAAVRGDQRVVRGRGDPNPDPDRVPNIDKGAEVAAKAGTSVWRICAGNSHFPKFLMMIYYKIVPEDY